MKGLIATVIAMLGLLASWLMGRSSQKKTEELKTQVANSESKAKAQEIETSSARKTAEVVSSISKAETERELTSEDFARKLSEAAASNEVDKVFELAGLMAERAANRINRTK